MKPALRIASVILTVLAAGLSAAPALAQARVSYFPGEWGDWATRDPEQAGFNAARLEEAVEYAREHETDRPRDLGAALNLVIGREPFGEIVGPARRRGATNGILIKDGYIVAEWGDTKRVDMTFSVTKTYLSTVFALAMKDGLIRDVHDGVGEYVQDGNFDVRDNGFYAPPYAPPAEVALDIPPDHNARITWHTLLNQTSQWHGTLFGKPDWADRFDGTIRPYFAPGTHYRYNDTRVNVLALALLHVFREPLPRVLRERVMDRIGASPTWRWYGYDTSWVTVDGLQMQSVSGGGHWGGGMHISTRDHARFGLFMLAGGAWDGEQILPEDWFERASTPGDINSGYGYMNWYLNHDGERYPSAPRSTITFLGAGTNMIWLEPEHGIVAVVRWFDDAAVDGFMKRVLEALSGDSSD